VQTQQWCVSRCVKLSHGSHKFRLPIYTAPGPSSALETRPATLFVLSSTSQRLNDAPSHTIMRVKDLRILFSPNSIDRLCVVGLRIAPLARFKPYASQSPIERRTLKSSWQLSSWQLCGMLQCSKWPSPTSRVGDGSL
jgi:hypothetical protein